MCHRQYCHIILKIWYTVIQRCGNELQLCMALLQFFSHERRMKQVTIKNRLSFNFPFDSIVSGMIKKAKYMYKAHIQLHTKVDIANITSNIRTNLVICQNIVTYQEQNQDKWRPKLNTACKWFCYIQTFAGTWYKFTILHV